MIRKSLYCIDFKALEDGKHSFSFFIDDAFFALFPESSVNKAAVKAEITMFKQPQSLRLSINLDGTIHVQCDRCLDYFEMPINYETELNVQFGDSSSDISDADTDITLAESELEIVLDKHFFDYINLCVPTRKIHSKDENGNRNCNVEMMELLNKHKLEENISDEEDIDPRWDSLRTLMN